MQYLLVFAVNCWFGIFHRWCLIDWHETLKTIKRIIGVLLLPLHLLLYDLIIGHRRLASLILSKFRKYPTSYSSFEIVDEFWRKHLVVLDKVNLIAILQSLQLSSWFTYTGFWHILRSADLVVQSGTIQGFAVDLAKELRLCFLTSSYIWMLGCRGMGLLLRR